MARSKVRKAKTEAVIDTSCLICLLYLGHLSKLDQLYEIVRIPHQVWNDVYKWSGERRRKNPKRPSIYQLQSALPEKHSFLKKCYVTDYYRVQLLTDPRQNPKDYIHRGEAEAIIQASELQSRGHNVSEVLMDERKGTNIARSFGLNIRGTAGVLALLKRDRIIKENVSFLIEKLRDEIKFSITDKVINQAMKEYGVE